MLKKLIEVVDYKIKTERMTIEFDKEKYLNLVKKIQKVQEIRNDIAHNYLVPKTEGVSNYFKGKSYKQLFQEIQEKKSSFKVKELDLERMQKESIEICDELESLSGEIITKILSVF